MTATRRSGSGDDSAEAVCLLAPRLSLDAPTLYALSLASGLAQAGHRPVVASPGGVFEPVFREREVPLELEPRLETPILSRLALRRLAERLRQKATLVHAQSSRTVKAGVALARRLGVPVVASVHRFAPEGARAIDWRGVQAVLVTDDALREDVVNGRRAPRDRVHVLPAGVALSDARGEPFEPGRAPVVATVAELDKKSALEAFFRAAKRVLEKVPSAQFLVIGDGHEPYELRPLIFDLGIEAQVTLTPVMDLSRSLPVADVCVLPSAEEGAGQVILETMAAARPLVAVGSGGAFNAVADEETGLLVEEPSAEALAGAVLRLLADRALGRRLGMRAREVASERFPLDRTLEETLRIYREARGG